MANQSVGKPRFYVDFTQLAKAKGFLHNPSKFSWANTNLSPLNALGLDEPTCTKMFYAFVSLIVGQGIADINKK